MPRALAEERNGRIVMYISSVMAVRETYARCQELIKVGNMIHHQLASLYVAPCSLCDYHNENFAAPHLPPRVGGWISGGVGGRISSWTTGINCIFSLLTFDADVPQPQTQGLFERYRYGCRGKNNFSSRHHVCRQFLAVSHLQTWCGNRLPRN